MNPSFLFRSASKSRRSLGFTVLEMLLIVVAIGFISAIAIVSISRALQEQKLRQAAFELSAHLQSARARAQRQNGICQLTISGTSLAPSNASNNVCAAAPALPTLDLAAVSGAAGLAIGDSSTGSITFSPYGVFASASSTSANLHRILTLSADGTTLQRCVFLDLVSIRIGWRNGSSGVCTYSSG